MGANLTTRQTLGFMAATDVALAGTAAFVGIATKMGVGVSAAIVGGGNLGGGIGSLAVGVATYLICHKVCRLPAEKAKKIAAIAACISYIPGVLASGVLIGKALGGAAAVGIGTVALLNVASVGLVILGAVGVYLAAVAISAIAKAIIGCCCKRGRAIRQDSADQMRHSEELRRQQLLQQTSRKSRTDSAAAPTETAVSSSAVVSGSGDDNIIKAGVVEMSPAPIVPSETSTSTASSTGAVAAAASAPVTPTKTKMDSSSASATPTNPKQVIESGLGAERRDSDEFDLPTDATAGTSSSGGTSNPAGQSHLFDSAILVLAEAGMPSSTGSAITTAVAGSTATGSLVAKPAS